MVSKEYLYDKLLEAHIQTGHGGRDKIVYYTKDKWKVKPACAVFLSCCKSCNRKRTAPKKGVVIKPIVTDDFNMRGQVEIFLRFFPIFFRISPKLTHRRNMEVTAEKIGKMAEKFGTMAERYCRKGKSNLIFSNYFVERCEHCNRYKGIKTDTERNLELQT